MISSNMDPRLAASVADTKDLQKFKSEMAGLKQSLSGTDPDRMAQLKKACQNFEAVFIGKLWEQMKKSVPKEGFLHSKQEESYLSMFDRDFSEKMAGAGGIGLADMIYGQLSQKLKQSSQETLPGGVSIKPLEPEPIALERAARSVPVTRKGGSMTLEDWGGTEAVDVSGGNRIPASDGAVETGGAGSSRLSDVEVQARLETLARRLEAERQGDASTPARNGQTKSGYKAEGEGAVVGRKLAEIG